MSEVHVNRAGENLGIFDLVDVEARYAAGSILSTDLIWKPGMPTWQPASEVFAHVSIKTNAPPPIPNQHKSSTPFEFLRSEIQSRLLTSHFRQQVL